MAQTRKAPFVHKFRTSSTHHVFDVNTLHIVKVDPVVWEVIDSVGSHSVEEAVRKHGGTWGEAPVRAAYKEIVQAQQEAGLFLPNRPKVRMFLSEKDVEAKLSKSREILILNLTERCNFACAYCANSQRNRTMKTESPDMSWQVAKAAMDHFMRDASPKHRAVTFYGGEPLLNFAVLRQCVNYVRSLEGGDDVYLGITTNGSLLRDEVTDFLVSQGVTITVSLDGPRELHDRYRRTVQGDPTWDVVVGNIERYRTRHPSHCESGNFGLSVVMAPPLDVTGFRDSWRSFVISPERIITLNVASGFNPDGTIAGMESLRERYVAKLRSGDLNEQGGGKSCRIDNLLFQSPFLFRHRRHEMYGSPHSERNVRRLPETYFASSSCVPGTRRTFVNADGELWPCERIAHTEYLRIGNVREGLDTANIRQLLMDWVDLNKEDCGDCWCLHGCQVGCFTNIGQGGKPTSEQKRLACERYRNSSHQELVEYCSILEENPRAMDFLERVVVS